MLGIYVMVDLCQAVLGMPYGIIKKKQKFPLLYPTNMKCVWLVIADKNFKVEINFLAFDTS